MQRVLLGTACPPRQGRGKSPTRGEQRTRGALRSRVSGLYVRGMLAGAVQTSNDDSCQYARARPWDTPAQRHANESQCQARGEQAHGNKVEFQDLLKSGLTIRVDDFEVWRIVKQANRDEGQDIQNDTEVECPAPLEMALQMTDQCGQEGDHLPPRPQCQSARRTDGSGECEAGNSSQRQDGRGCAAVLFGHDLVDACSSQALGARTDPLSRVSHVAAVPVQEPHVPSK